MIWRLVILACAVAAILLGGLACLVIWAALSFAVFLLAAALHRGWYR